MPRFSPATAWVAQICCAAPWARRSRRKWTLSGRPSSKALSPTTFHGADASRIFELVAKFAGYGFNKSHAAAYALVAYQTAYLKANHPVEFLAASMSLEINNIDRLELFRRELERLGIPLLPPDINASRATFSVEQLDDGTKAIRYALGAIRNVGVQAMTALADERAGSGPYRDPFDFAGRIDPHQINRRQIENLAKAGAFDSLTSNRRQLGRRRRGPPCFFRRGPALAHAGFALRRCRCDTRAAAEPAGRRIGT